MHIGSQITRVEPYVEALAKVLEFAERASSLGSSMRCINIGGGFAIYYKEREALPIHKFAEEIIPLLENRRIKFIIEPGRYVVGNAGILVTKVLYIKEGGKKFVICDSGMNHLIRPSLYGSYHRIWPVETEIEPLYIEDSKGTARPSLEKVDVVGPICESADFFARDRMIPRVKRGDYLAIFSAGAYGMTMSSNYNSQPKPPEVVVDGEHFTVVRMRESYEDIIRQENIERLY
jgi:diaminopimelate decarboxylase